MDGNKITIENIQEINQDQGAYQNKTATFLDLFTNGPEITKATFKICLNWMTSIVVYYGLLLSTGDLPGNEYLNIALAGIVDMLACVVFQFLIGSPKLGRRFSSLIMFLSTGIFILISTLVQHVQISDQEHEELQLSTILIDITSFLARFSINTSLCITFQYAGECFPTAIRTVGMGFCGLVCNSLSIFTPFIVALSGYYAWLPSAIFAFLAFCAAVNSYFLPETLGIESIHTFEQARQLYRGRK